MDSLQIVSKWGDRYHRSFRDYEFVIHLSGDTDDRFGKRHDVVLRGNADDLDDWRVKPERFLHAGKLK